MKRSTLAGGGKGIGVAAIVAFTACDRVDSKLGHGTSAGAMDAAAEIRFEDMRPDSGIHFPLAYDLSRDVGIRETLGHPAALLDADGDGRLDVLLAGPDQVALFRNLGDWQFLRVPEAETGLRQAGYWQGVAVGDVDGDGLADVFLSGFGCAAFYRNRGGGRFEEVTREAAWADVPAGAWLTSAAFADVDLDGRLDLYVGGYVELGGRVGACTYPGGIVTGCSPKEFPAQRGSFHRNVGGWRFVDATAAYGLETAEGKTLGVAFGDSNRDGYPDLYLANDQVPCDLYLNQGGQSFAKAGVRSGTAYGIHGGVQAGMGVAFGDYDGDGLEDLVVSNYEGEPTSLYRNQGADLFANDAYNAGTGTATTPYVGWGVQWADLDNDGRLDFAMANGHPLHRIHELDPSTDSRQPFQIFWNLGQGRFREVSHVGTGLPRAISGRALCTGDLDNDGRIDLLISDIEGEPLLLRNTTASEHRWLRVRLAGAGVLEGAFVSLTVGTNRWTRRCLSSGSFLSAQDPRVHFGCGRVEGRAVLEVRWPGGLRTVVQDPAFNTELVVTRPAGAGGGAAARQ